MPVKNKGTHSRLKKTLLIIAAILLLTAGIVAILEVTNTTYWFHTKPFKPVKTAGAGTKGTEGAPSGSTSSVNDGSTGSSSGTTDSSGPSSDPGETSNTPNVTLQAPSGVFVSNHHSTTLSTIQSTCSTTSGATCKIIFARDGVTKSLAAQGTDASGATYWQWQPKTIGLTPGTWTVTAQSNLGSQQQTSTDPLQLEIAE